MGWKIGLASLATMMLAGCYVGPVPPPRERVIQREVVDQNGNVIERDTIAEDGPVPGERVEVVPIRPYPTAIWVRGYWLRDRYRHRWIWVGGHWR